MNRRTFSAALPVLLVALPAFSATTGFKLTHEEALSFPPLKQFTMGYAAPIGKVEVFSDQTAYLDNDPAGVMSRCDLTSTKTLVLDTTTRVAEVHLAFPMTAQGRYIIFDKVEVGAEFNNKDGLRVGVYSGVTHRPEVDFEFRADGMVYVFGQPVDIGSGNSLRYDNVWNSDCTKGIDNHITVQLFHNLVGGTVMVQLDTHGSTGNTYKLGPFTMSAEVKKEGIAGIYLSAPPQSGRYTADGMVCTGDAPIILPTGSDEDGGSRTRR